jgi:phasin family protein
MGSLIHAALQHGRSGGRLNKKATTMTKTKNTATAELYAGADVLKTGFDKTAKMLENTAKFGKGNVEAYVESAKIAGEGFRTISSEISLYSKKAIEESVAATKAIMGSKSIHEAMEHQTSFAKMAFGAYVGQMKILNELIVGAAKDTLAPLQGRVEAFSQIAQNATAA